MDTAMPREGLMELFDQTMRDVTERAYGISLSRKDVLLEGDLYTVHISFVKELHTSISFCAEKSLFIRLTQYMMQSEEVTLQDMEDFSKEYFNILCGHIAARLFRATKIPARFGVPSFYHGRYTPENYGNHFVIGYIGDRNENAQLTHHMPKTREAAAE